MNRGGATYFLSDLHLGAKYLPDPRATERKAVAFLEMARADAERIYLLGDILDYWFEYRTVVPRGNVRFFGKLAELADNGIEITWLIGNHDIWIFDYLPTELGIRVADGPLIEQIDGRTIYMAHGDAEHGGSRMFRAMRRLFRNRICQKLYSGIHPRWTIPFATGWSGLSRMQDKAPEKADALLMAAPLADFARHYHETHPEADTFIFGHLHSPVMEEIAPGCTLMVLGDWADTCAYARLDPSGLSMHRFE